MVILSTRGLTTGYEDREVLRKVSFNIEKGRMVGIIGPNGSGKSTLIRAITGVIPCWGGKVYIGEEDLQRLSIKEVARMTAVVPQDTFISFPYTAWEVVLMGRTPYLGRFESPGKEDRDIAEKSMKETGTSRFKDRSVRELSGGELQRVMVGRALAQRPDILLLDEATSHLDIGYKVEVMDLIRKKNREDDLTVLSVHHDLNLAARYCDRIILMDEGEIHASGTPREVLTPSHLRAVYGIEAGVREDPRDGSLYITPIERKEEIKGRVKKDIKVHVIGGGGTAGSILKDLVEEGYRVSTGVLNVMDSDFESANFLDLPMVNEAPFSPISEEAMKKNLEMIQGSDIIICTDFPIGPGNLKNFKAAVESVEEGEYVIILRGGEIEERDYTRGEASRLWTEVRKRDNLFDVSSEERLLEMVKELTS